MNRLHYTIFKIFSEIQVNKTRVSEKSGFVTESDEFNSVG